MSARCLQLEHELEGELPGKVAPLPTIAIHGTPWAPLPPPRFAAAGVVRVSAAAPRMVVAEVLWQSAQGRPRAELAR